MTWSWRCAKPACDPSARPPPPAREATAPVAGCARHRARRRGQHGSPLLSLRLGARRTLLVSAYAESVECFAARDAALAGRPRLLAGNILGYGYTDILWSSYGDHWRALREFFAAELLSTSCLAAHAVGRRAEVAALVVDRRRRIPCCYGDPAPQAVQVRDQRDAARAERTAPSAASTSLVAPDEFRPERFLVGGAVTTATVPMLPFGIGRRRCPGENLGTRLVSVALAALVQCFEWDVFEGCANDMTEGGGLSMPMATPLAAGFLYRY
ncbi:hypothetical protein U9M48_032495 [Paspalum notatum var. saurae]|uniref:Uncharacterized protein n=1 Tax=Paspalum notatum var. saurae TaxID=547442 RepID=A0AAQ3U5N9_PASNO